MTFQVKKYRRVHRKFVFAIFSCVLSFAFTFNFRLLKDVGHVLRPQRLFAHLSNVYGPVTSSKLRFRQTGRKSIPRSLFVYKWLLFRCKCSFGRRFCARICPEMRNGGRNKSRSAAVGSASHQSVRTNLRSVAKRRRADD